MNYTTDLSVPGITQHDWIRVVCGVDVKCHKAAIFQFVSMTVLISSVTVKKLCLDINKISLNLFLFFNGDNM